MSKFASFVTTVPISGLREKKYKLQNISNWDAW